MRKKTRNGILDRAIEHLYDNAISAVQMNGRKGDWFRTTVAIKEGCLLSPTFFIIFLNRFLSDALGEDDEKVSIDGRNITNLRFADNIDALAEEEQDQDALYERLDKRAKGIKWR